jgi:hypothetical protein
VASIASCVLAVYAEYSHFYREAGIRELTTPFSIGPLRGLKSTPERVNKIEAVSAFLTQRLRPGDTLLAYNSSCVGLHYLTQTRPALKVAWITQSLTPRYYERLIGDMCEANRVPRYCVRAAVSTAHIGNPYCPDRREANGFGEGMSPVHTYVRKHYIPIRTIYPFQIWENQDEASTAYRRELLGETHDDFSHWKGQELLGASDQPNLAGSLRVGKTLGKFVATAHVAEGGRLLNIRAGELLEEPIEISFLGRIRRALTGEPLTKKTGSLTVYLEMDNVGDLGEKQTVLTADIAVDKRNAAYFFIEDETEAGAETRRCLIPPGMHRNIGVDTVTRPGTTKVRGGIVFQPSAEGQELSVGNVRLCVEEFSAVDPATMPADDILGNKRGPRPDIGCYVRSAEKAGR